MQRRVKLGQQPYSQSKVEQANGPKGSGNKICRIFGLNDN